MANLRIARKKAYGDYNIPYNVYLDGSLIGAVENGCEAEFAVEAGEHIVCITSNQRKSYIGQFIGSACGVVAGGFLDGLLDLSIISIVIGGAAGGLLGTLLGQLADKKEPEQNSASGRTVSRKKRSVSVNVSEADTIIISCEAGYFDSVIKRVETV